MGTAQIIAIIGAGLMGQGIASQFAIHGFEVRLNDLTDDVLERALNGVMANLNILVDVGLIDKSELTQAFNRIKISDSLEDSVYNADLIVEAISENLELKKQLFNEMGAHVSKTALISSNTSSFMPSQLSDSVSYPECFLVANWWNPPYLLPLVEVVPGAITSANTTKTICNILENAGKLPIILKKESKGFIGNRLQLALLREAISIVENGVASAKDIDTVVTNSFGRRLAIAGPFEVFDIAGWDTISAIIGQLYPDLESKSGHPKLINNMLTEGKLGIKSGKGFYGWSDDSIKSRRQKIGEALAAIDRLSKHNIENHIKD